MIICDGKSSKCALYSAFEKYERGPMSSHAVSLWNFKGNAQDKCKSEHNHRR